MPARTTMFSDFLALSAEHPCRETSRNMDENLRNLLPNLPAICLIATGGYGRGTLAPFSDIDILFLHEAPLTLPEETAIRSLLHTLWDNGKCTGHAVRTVAETLQLAQENHATFTSLLDARYIAGNAALYETLALSVGKLLATHRDAFIHAKCSELYQRHAAFSGKPLNILKSTGGLRDLQTLHWLAQAGSTSSLRSGDAVHLSAHHQCLWNLRSALTEDTLPTHPEGLARKMQQVWQDLIAPRITSLGNANAA